MTKTAGQVIRIIGLVIEMVGVWGVYRSSVNDIPLRGRPPDVTGISWPWITVAAGFVIWLTGRLMVYSSGRSKQKAIWQNQRELTP